MARSDKDNLQKERALRFAVATNQVAFLEVDIFTPVDLSEAPKKITDIDVLAVRFESSGKLSRTVFDCKSVGGPTIARALWLSGLLGYTGCDQGFMLIGKDAERAHRLAARKLNVNVYSPTSFEDFAKAINPAFRIFPSYVAEIENWHSRNDHWKKNPALSSIDEIIRNEIPLSRDAARTLRKVISQIRPLKGELNPKKDPHYALFVEIVFAVAFLIEQIVKDLRNIIDLADDEKTFKSTLKYYIWGGPEGVRTLQRMYEVLSNARDDVEQESELISWNDLVQLIRQLLEAPDAVAEVVITLRELGLRVLAKQDDDADNYLGARLTGARNRQFLKRLALYTVKVLRLPEDFLEKIEQNVDELVENYEARMRPNPTHHP